VASKPTSPPEPSSRWIWPFELKERLGEGGMGVVYRGRYVVKDIDVAVKMLPDDVTNPIVLARFEREVEVLNSLQHPNIVRSFGGVCEDKRRFYAMELMSGGSLEDQLQQRGRLPWETVVEYARQMCAALVYLHEHGVVHRDLKPANFLLDDQGRLKLSDFGLASVIAARRITTAGKTAGTLLYMAPEQIRGGDITPQTDLYALGCVLYELLTGQPPFIGDTPAETMHRHCRAEIPRITPIVLDCPVALEKLIIQLLAKEPADRPADAQVVGREVSLVTYKISVISRPRPIDSDTFKRSPQPSESSVEMPFKETRELGHVAARRTYLWPFLASLLVIAGLLTWGFRLQQSTEKAARAEELWVAAIHSDQPLVRIHALEAVGQLPHLNDESVDAVADVLLDTTETPDVRMAAASSLGEMGHRAREFVPMLHRHWSQDSSAAVREESQIALQRIQADRRSTGVGWFTLLCAIAAAVTAGFVWWRKIGHALIHESRTPHGTG